MHRVKESTVNSYDGASIYYRSWGEGLPMVLCDGIGCDGYVWKYLTNHLEKSNRFVHWHYRGHGKTPPPENMNHLTIQDCCRDLAAVMDDDGVDKAVILGHSMGSQVILEFYRMYPERVLGLIPICGSYGYPLDTFHDNKTLKTLFPFLYPVFVLFPEPLEVLWKRIIPTKFSLWIAKHTEINGRLIDNKDFMPYFEHISKMSLRLFAKMLDHASQHTCEDILHKIDVPVLIVAAPKDTFTPMWLSEKMKKEIPGSEMLLVPEGTHTAPIEMPELVCLRIEKWLLDHYPEQAERQYPRPKTAKEKEKAKLRLVHGA